MKAPVTVIIGFDVNLRTHADKTFPQIPATQQAFKDYSSGSQIAAFRNGSLQGAYFIITSQALGIDCWPMSGFDNPLVDQEFLLPPHLDQMSFVTLATEIFAERSSAYQAIGSMTSTRLPVFRLLSLQSNMGVIVDTYMLVGC